MDGRAFLAVARRLARQTTEADWRAAAGRAYYALVHEAAAALARWGMPAPPRNQFHPQVRLRFTYALDADLQLIGRALEKLGQLRNQADYELQSLAKFASAIPSQKAIADAEHAIALLDAIDADPTRRAAAVATLLKTRTP